MVASRLCRRCGGPRSVYEPCPGCGAPAMPRPDPELFTPPDVLARRRKAHEAAMPTLYRKAFKECEFPVYGLDESWTGARSPAGFGNRDGQTLLLGLHHGDWQDPDEPYVRVETAGKRLVAQALADELFCMTGVHTDAMRQTMLGPNTADSWDDAAFSVDGAETAAKLLRAGPGWAAVIGNVAVLARHVDPGAVRLVQVDPFAYLGP